jgi:lipoate---protein ligase
MMHLIEFTAPTLQENLAFDEAMLEAADQWSAEEKSFPDSLRLWEMPQACVILGRGSKIDEANADRCRVDGVPILRRCSGGASVVAGPGCLMYSLVLSLERQPELREIDKAHRIVMGRMAVAVQSLVTDVELHGTCDLTIRMQKISGNAVRYKRHAVLYHGTLLYDFPLEWISRYLAIPPRMPDYRQRRNHADFVRNVACDGSLLRQALIKVWDATGDWLSHPARTDIMRWEQHLLQNKYS